ncbi:hypothetical protein JCM3765_007818 [Sporobolomyces pararoseus]
MPTFSASSPSSSTPTPTIGNRTPTTRELHPFLYQSQSRGMITEKLDEQIWKRHRPVCGARSKPFRFPGFTQTEIDECKKYAYSPVMEDGRPTGKVELELLGDGLFRGKFAKFETLLERLREGEGCTINHERSLYGLRGWLFDMRIASATGGNPSLLTGSGLLKKESEDHPFDWLARWVRILDPDGDFSSSGPPWTSEYLHRQLIFHYLLEKFGSDHPYTRNAAEQIASLANQVIRKTHPRQAEEILKQTF